MAALAVLAWAAGCSRDADVLQALEGAHRAVACDRELDDEAGGNVACVRYNARGSPALRTGLYLQALVTLDLAARSGIDDAAAQLTVVRPWLDQALGEQPAGARQALVHRFCVRRWPDCTATAQRIGIRLNE